MLADVYMKSEAHKVMNGAQMDEQLHCRSLGEVELKLSCRYGCFTQTEINKLLSPSSDPVLIQIYKVKINFLHKYDCVSMETPRYFHDNLSNLLWRCSSGSEC
ncbi:hypothetical protein XENORESO_007529 [Xenotaenia resolanae]|uniref:Uncharacterized protein n=1 Tax=Xenotaenia resolanae TaxID=208358 RepID=A0ABV0WDL2_9TELE